MCIRDRFSRWNVPCTRDVQQLGGFQFKDIAGQWTNYDDASQTTLLDYWNPTAEPRAFNLNVQDWGYTIILDPERTLHLTQIDSSGDVIGVQIAVHVASPKHTMRWMKYIPEQTDFDMTDAHAP